jgi:hypothetical protein
VNDRGRKFAGAGIDRKEQGPGFELIMGEFSKNSPKKNLSRDG